MKKLFLLFGLFFLGIHTSLAALPGQMNLKSEYLLFVLPTKTLELWTESEHTYFQGKEIILSDTDKQKIPPNVLEIRKEKTVNTVFLIKFLQDTVALGIAKEAQGSKLSLKDNKVVFNGEIAQGKKLNIPLSVSIITRALQDKIDEVELAVDTIAPPLEIPDDLQKMGIKEVIAVGESNFSGSSKSRVFNVLHGASRFQGQIFPQGADISFNTILGPVNQQTGYKQELVIKGNQTLPDWGGGLCQVSSTLYRGIMLAGFPIHERSNHSYAVSYYSPPGSDATIYPGSHDLRFTNDSPGAVTLQVYAKETKLFFVILGTKNNTTVDLFGPYITNPISAPPTKFLPSKTLAAGQQFLVSPAHNGFTSTWFRKRSENIEKYVSKYDARPKIYKVGGLIENTN